ncbi:MAG: hypothetical protein BROFUL_02400, partial [Candidatus Brocadia fulgida]
MGTPSSKTFASGKTATTRRLVSFLLQYECKAKEFQRCDCGATRFVALVRLRVHNVRGVKVPFRENAF